MEQMVRKASDNKYLHKDFHNHMNLGLEYLRTNYGEEAVREYLRQYADVFYRPLKDKVNENGLAELERYFHDIYLKEEALKDISFERCEDELVIRIKRCPAVTHMRKSNVEVSPLYVETILTINTTMVESTPFAFELVSYNEEDGASIQRFYRKESAK